MKRKEPYVNLSWPIYILFVALGCLLAKILFDGLKINSIYNWSIPIILYDFICLLYGFVISVLVYQTGKIIFAKIAGFDIFSASFFFFALRKENGKFKVIPGHLDGFNCKVVLIPNKDKKQNTSLALWGGTISVVVVFALTYGLIFGLQADATTKCFFLISSAFYVFTIIAYMIPVKMDNMNDGFTLHLIRKYKLEDVYLSNLRNYEAMFDETKELEVVDAGENNDPISMEAKVFNFYAAIRKNDEAFTKKCAEELSINYKFVVGEYYTTIALIAQAYAMCLNGQFDELKDYFWKLDTNSRKILRNVKSLESLKVGLYISGIVDDSREGFYEIVNAIDKCASTYKYKAQVNAELALVNEIKDKILTENPDLKFEDNKD